MAKIKIGRRLLLRITVDGLKRFGFLKIAKLRQGFASVLISSVLIPQVQADAALQLTAALEKEREKYASIALKIWDYAELGYLEARSSALLQDTLAAEGFRIEAGVAKIPTAFVASFGKGEPVIGILAEFDALPLD